MSLILSGTDGLSDVDGSAATPAIRGTDANTGIFFGADIIGFSEGGVEAMRIDASGNVGIGTNSPTSALTLGSGRDMTYLATGYSSWILKNYQGTYYFNNGTDRIAFDSSGYVGINMTPSGAGGQFQIRYDSSARACLRLETSNASTAGELINFIKSTGSATGAISFGASQNTIVYGGTSDYRLKDDIQPMTNALATVAQLKPVTYKWKSDSSNGQGFIAHELQSVLPDAVVGEKDAVETYIDEDNKEQTRPKYQQIDTSFLVATLTAAIKEQQAIIQSLTTRIAVLEAK